MSKFAGLQARACLSRHVVSVSMLTIGLTLVGVAHADLDAGALGAHGEALVGVAVARDRPNVVAVWGRDFVWFGDGNDGWVRVQTAQPIDRAALSRDGSLYLASDDRIGVMSTVDAELTWGAHRDT